MFADLGITNKNLYNQKNVITSLVYYSFAYPTVTTGLVYVQPIFHTTNQIEIFFKILLLEHIGKDVLVDKNKERNEMKCGKRKEGTREDENVIDIFIYSGMVEL